MQRLESIDVARGIAARSPAKPIVLVGFRNGLSFADAVPEIFGSLTEEFDFVESVTPRLAVSGPYGAEPAPRGALNVGYLCENIWPEPAEYDWCFGAWREEVVDHPRYTRITWHGFDPRTLVKTPVQVAAWLARPRKFCNFFYSNPVRHREEFCRALSRYRPVDCPGESLRNHPPIDQGGHDRQKWDRKRDFLAAYRFTVAFENSSAPGYHTEKILDPMVAGSIPVYWGDPTIAQTFNPRSFINVADYITPPSRALDATLRRFGRRTHRDYRPALFSGPLARVTRRWHRLCSGAADRLLRARGWAPLIDAIREINEDESRYAAMLAEPWFIANQPPPDPMRAQWRQLLRQCAG